MNAPAQSVVRLCGGLSLEVRGVPLDERVPAGQAALVLAFLIVNRARDVRRDELIDAIWGERPPSDPHGVVSTLISRLRRQLPELEFESRSRLSVRLPEPVWVDLETIESDIAEALRAEGAGDHARAYEQVRAALDEAGSELLAGLDVPWAAQVRRQLDASLESARECLARNALAGGPATLDEGRRAAVEVIERSPFHEAGYVLLMRVLEAEGNTAEGLQVYEDLRRLLSDELGSAPGAAAQEVHRRLLDGGAPRPTPLTRRVTGALPPARTTFLGREEDRKELRSLLDRSRTVTLVGPGGMGKTRLALNVAEGLDADLIGGAWFADLAPLDDPDLVGQAVASAIGAREDPGRTVLETVADHLRAAELCLILDNCEHVLDGAREVAAVIAGSCPQVRLLATSRERLSFEGESVWQIAPLATDTAMELFRQRATAAAGDFRIVDANRGAVAAICERLDGMPLAVELAAALVAEMGVAEIADRLDERLRFSMEAGPLAPARHRTLEALVDWSYELLAEPERALLQRLSVFHGGATLDAVESICGEADADTLSLLRSLVKKSLVSKEERGGSARYRMLETIRQFAERKLAESGAADALRTAHLDHFCAFAESAEPLLAEGSEQVPTLDRLELELDNFRAALGRGLACGGEPARTALRLGGALFVLWYIRGHMSEGRAWLDRLAAACEGDVSEARSKALAASGELAREQGDYETAHERLTEALGLARELGTVTGWAGAPFILYNLGAAAWEQGEYDAATTLIEECLAAIPDRGGDPAAPPDVFDVAWPQLKLGQVALDQGDAARARQLLELSLSGHRARGDREGIARALEWLSRAALAGGDRDGARLLGERSLVTARELGYKEGVPGPLQVLARVQLAAGSADEAVELTERALEACVELSSKRGIASSVEGLACALAARGEGARALQLLGFAAGLRQELRCPPGGHLRAELDAATQAARASVAEELAAAAWSAGVSMTVDGVAELARSGRAALAAE